ncbi:N-acetyldiaminopimelate deacetylase [uncultured Clostridium sp.]|uniref:M20 metallopeptidase family protein n=1 Tax=uncultured Clostridium sp. TaxID=59620 RepID=UPI00082083D7|nr:M20 family metallopeptidase [uncultured Clostridium sp.]SCJ98864.1 N-acetyldiaminopimelate deacetylase [uncultured Clostridium sp.]
MAFKKEIYIDEVRTYRRELHKMPEVGFCEVNTSKYIREKLESFGYEVKSVAKTGLIAFRGGENVEESIAFRADMDGLKILEETNVDFKSKNYDYMHACGHDGHMSILLGFAHYITTIKSLNKGILFIFQPAEEGPGGAEIIVKEGILERYNAKHVFGLHLFPGLNEGEIGIKPGSMMAQTAEFDIDIKAQSGHGAVPHKANDGIIVAGQLISSFQSIISRNVNPIEGAVLTIGTINGGERRNIIAENIRLEGTLRAFDKEVYSKIKNRMIDITKGLEIMFNVNINIEFRDMYPAVRNDRKLLKSIIKFLPEEKIVEIDPMMLAEDFAYYQESVPSLFFMLGVKNEELGYIHQLHSSKFNFNEEVLVEGIELYNRICEGLKIY